MFRNSIILMCKKNVSYAILVGRAFVRVGFNKRQLTSIHYCKLAFVSCQYPIY